MTMINSHLVPDSSSYVISTNLALISTRDIVEVLVLLPIKVLWSLTIVKTHLSLLFLINKSLFRVFWYQLPHHSTIMLNLFIFPGFRRDLVFPNAPLQTILWRFVSHSGLNFRMLFLLHRWLLWLFKLWDYACLFVSRYAFSLKCFIYLRHIAVHATQDVLTYESVSDLELSCWASVVNGAVRVAAYLEGFDGFGVVEVAELGAVVGDAILRRIELLRIKLKFVLLALVLLELDCVILLAVVMKLPVWHHQVLQTLLLWTVIVIIFFLVTEIIIFSVFIVQIHFWEAAWLFLVACDVRVLLVVTTTFGSRIQTWTSSLHRVVWLRGHYHVILPFICVELRLLRLLWWCNPLETRNVLRFDVWLSLSADQWILKRD